MSVCLNTPSSGYLRSIPGNEKGRAPETEARPDVFSARSILHVVRVSAILVIAFISDALDGDNFLGLGGIEDDHTLS